MAASIELLDGSVQLLDSSAKHRWNLPVFPSQFHPIPSIRLQNESRPRLSLVSFTLQHAIEAICLQERIPLPYRQM